MKDGDRMSNNISSRDMLVQDFVDNYMEKIFSISESDNKLIPKLLNNI